MKSSLHSSATVVDQTDLSVNHNGRVVLINQFTANPGALDQFIAIQKSEYVALRGKVKGFIANRLHRAVDGKSAVNIAIFDSLENYKAWRESELFRKHVEVIQPYIAKSEPGIYEIVYEGGHSNL